MITELTEEQRAQIDVYAEKFLKIATDTTPANRQLGEEVMKAIYKYRELSEPVIYWADSPYAGLVKAAQLSNNTDTPTDEQINEMKKYVFYANFECHWKAFYAYLAEVLNVPNDNFYKLTIQLAENCGAYFALDGAVVMCEKPVKVFYDPTIKGHHNPDGLAVEYKDGSGSYAYKGKKYNTLLDMEMAKQLEITE